MIYRVFPFPIRQTYKQTREQKNRLNFFHIIIIIKRTAMFYAFHISNADTFRIERVKEICVIS